MFASSTALIEMLNRWGESHFAFASAMLVQSGILLVVLAGLDVLLLRRLRAAVRYAVWSLLLVKLLLPVSLASPTGLGRWLPVTTVAAPATESYESADRWPLPQLTTVETFDRADSMEFASQAESPAAASPTLPPAPERTETASEPAIASQLASIENASVNPASVRPGWPALLLLLWAGSALLLTGIAVRQSLAVRRLVRRSVPAPPDLQSLFLESAEAVGVAASALRLRVSDDLGSPAICGFRTGTVIVPRSILATLNRDQLRFVLVHEVMHWKRWDLQVNFLQTVLQIAYAYNPVVWIGNAVLRRLREQAVDEAVLVALGSSPQPYGDTLLKVATAIRVPPGLSVRLIGVVESGTALSGRIRRMLTRPVPRTARLGAVGLALLLATAMALLPMAQSSPGSPPELDPSSDPVADFPHAVDEVQVAQVGPDEPTESSAPAAATDTSPGKSEPPDPQQIVARLSERSQLWIRTPTIRLRTLQYSYELGGDTREVELVRENWKGPIGQWFGATLSTGLHHLLQSPDACDVRAERIAAEGEKPETIRLTITPKPGSPTMKLAIGNGIANTWRGYFEHGWGEMTIDVDPERMVPLRESHGIKGGPHFTEINYDEYEEVEPGQWTPRQIDVTHDELVFRMSFAWQQDSVWLLTQTEYANPSGASIVARVSNVRINDEHFLEQRIARERRRSEAFAVLTDMLDRNQPWLLPGYSDVESLRYTFHTVREDVREECLIAPDGTTMFEVLHDGQGKMGDKLGRRWKVTPNGEWLAGDREWTTVTSPLGRRNAGRRPTAFALRHYGRIGCQFDLPLFRLSDLVDRADIDVRDGEWNGTPCHVATVRGLGPDVYLGCGTMLAFTSWSYMHHLRPVVETIYIDKERMVPIHETFVTDSTEQPFEIDFGDYRELMTQQWAPLSIRLESKDKFTCEYRFQLVGETHWLLSEVESWFDPADKSRGVVVDLSTNPPLPPDKEADR